MHTAARLVAASWTALVLVASPAASAAPRAAIGERFPRAAPSEMGVDAEKLLGLFRYLAREQKAVQDILVVKGGKVVLEAHAWPHRADGKRQVYSVTKSVTSTLVGMAIADGAFRGTDERLTELFPGREMENLGERKQRMTLGDLLSMQSGLEWIERDDYVSQDDSRTYMLQSEDPTQYVLDRPMREEPGISFTYSTGDSQILGAALQARTGKTAEAYAREKLFGPMKITDVHWWKDRTGTSFGGFGLFLRPEDMAKLGQLFLDQGRWNGAQLVPAPWVAAATSQKARVAQQSEAAGYGYQWWLNRAGGFSARGLGGQYVYVIPALDLVVVFCSELANEDAGVPPLLMDLYVLPAARGGGSPRADEALREGVAAFERKPEPQPPALPASLGAIDGARYEWPGNTIVVTFPATGEVLVDWTFAGRSHPNRIGVDGVPRLSELEDVGPFPGKNAFFAVGGFDGEALTFRMSGLAGWPEHRFRLELGADELHLTMRDAFSGRVLLDQRAARVR